MKSFPFSEKLATGRGLSWTLPPLARDLARRSRHFLNSAWFMALLLAQIVGALAWFGHDRGVLQAPELFAYDGLRSLESARHSPDPRITLVLCDEADQRRWSWPLSDRVLVQALNILENHDAAVIGLDIYRDLPVPSADTPAYQKLRRIFEHNRRIIGIRKLPGVNGARVAPPPGLSFNQVGFNDMLLDQDGVVRRGALFIHEDGRAFEAFALHLAKRYLKQRGIYLRNHPQNRYHLLLGESLLFPLPPDFGGYSRANSGGYQILLSYPAAGGEQPAFDTLTLSQLLERNFTPELIQDRIVILGTASRITPDFFATPLNRQLPGATLHAYFTSQLLRLGLGKTALPRALKTGGEFLWISAWALLGAVLYLLAARVWQLAIFFLLAGSGLVALSAGLFLAGWWLPLATPLLALALGISVNVLWFTYREQHQRHLLMHLFGKHVSREVADLIWRSREQYLKDGGLRPRRLTATVLLTDLQNFTTVSERMEPTMLMEWLNDYMDEMVNIVENHHGQVQKFIGDAILVLFWTEGQKDPSGVERDARNAVSCALDMEQKISELHIRWLRESLPKVRMRVGICTGPLVAGSLGGARRQEFSIFGDTLTIAARLESFDKHLAAEHPCRILIGGSTRNLLNNAFHPVRVGRLEMKNRLEPVEVYQVSRQRINGG